VARQMVCVVMQLDACMLPSKFKMCVIFDLVDHQDSNKIRNAKKGEVSPRERQHVVGAEGPRRGG
jgi:hypothetical protein